MKWFDIIKLNSAQEASIQAARRKNISAAQRKEYENVSPAPDLTELSNEQAPSAPDLQREQRRIEENKELKRLEQKLEEAKQSNNSRQIAIYNKKLNALRNKKLDATAPPIPKPEDKAKRMERDQYGRKLTPPLRARQKLNWKKVLKPNPQALQEARDRAAKPNQPQSEESEEKPKLTLPNEKPPHLSDEQWEKMKQDWNKRRRSIYG